MGKMYGFSTKTPEDLTLCREEILRRWSASQCSRKRGKGPNGDYCAQHGRFYAKKERDKRERMKREERQRTWDAKVDAMPKTERLAFVESLRTKRTRWLELESLLRSINAIHFPDFTIAGYEMQASEIMHLAKEIQGDAKEEHDALAEELKRDDRP